MLLVIFDWCLQNLRRPNLFNCLQQVRCDNSALHRVCLIWPTSLLISACQEMVSSTMLWKCSKWRIYCNNNNVHTFIWNCVKIPVKTEECFENGLKVKQFGEEVGASFLFIKFHQFFHNYNSFHIYLVFSLTHPKEKKHLSKKQYFM